jgi:hypothetical protein
MKTARLWAFIFALPQRLAAMISPASRATIRRPVTANSRITMIAAIQAAIEPSATRAKKIETIRALSAMESISLPKPVTSLLLLATIPSK